MCIHGRYTHLSGFVLRKNEILTWRSDVSVLECILFLVSKLIIIS